MSRHFMHSSYREKLIEHLFIGELLKHSWIAGDCALEIAQPEVDNAGYDLIAEDRGVIRHIQLKASQIGSRTAQQKIHTALAGKPSGCVIWVFFDEESLELGPFLYFGSTAGQPLPAIEHLKVARHTKANAQGVKAERPAIRVVNKGQFERIDSVSELYGVLFGRL